MAGLVPETRRRLLTAGAGGLAGVIGAACGQEAAAPGKQLTKETAALSVGYPWTDAYDRFDDAAAAFHGRHPNLKVERIAFEGNYNDKMFAMFAGNAAPDMMAANNDVVPDFVKPRMFLELDALMRRDNRDIKEYHPFPIRIYQWQGKQYLLPDSLNMTVMFVNKTLFDAQGQKLPPVDFKSTQWTFDDMLEAGKRLTRKQGDRPVWGFYTSDWIGRWFPFLWGLGGQPMDDMWAPKKWTFDSQPSVDAVQYLQDLIWKHGIQGNMIETTGQNSFANLFQRGQLAMGLEVMSQNTLFQKITEFEWQIYPVPRGPSGRFNRMAGAGLGVSTQTKYPNESWEFVKFLTGPDAPTRSGAVSYLAPHRGKMSDPQFMNLLPGKGKQVILDTLEYARLQPLHEKWRQIDNEAIRPELKPVFLNERAPRQGVKIVSEKALGILAAP
ncbi:MAG TPA: sugar ABC transporter substrate-binding protein [Chloroflexota bacterium]|nr:sugar ABC transporter substrate-binding protein [Chloroflexota bacterium]